MRDPELLKAMGLGDKLIGSLIVMVLGLATCMIILFIIQMVVKLLRIVGGKEDRSEVPAPPVPAPAPPVQIQSVPEEEPDEVVAAIITAVTSMQNGKPFMIKNITPAGQRESWSEAGLADAFENRKISPSDTR
jgi:Na+-transporting methylmalonyl-CoA/oxaloacetate decarboxylase gamma subunit